jgi:hypothetical protein
MQKSEIDNLHMKSEIDNLHMKLKDELMKTIGLFINEIELVFEYVNNVERIKTYTDKLSENDTNLTDFIKETLENLKEYEENILMINSNNKVKSSDFNFLSNLKMFNNLLNFDVFRDENKNTKKTIVKYVYSIYMSSFILNFGLQSNDLINQTELLSFVSVLEEKLKPPQNSLDIKKSSTKSDGGGTLPTSVGDGDGRGTGTLGIDNILPQMLSGMGNLPGLGLGDINGLSNIFQSLMANNDIMNIASDLSKDIKNENIDPMSLLTSLMSGQPNDKLNKLVTNITNKIETKINNGEIDKDLLEKQAENIMSSVQNKNLFDKL